MKYERYGLIGQRELQNVRMVIPADRTGRLQHRTIAVCPTGEDAALIVDALNKLGRDEEDDEETEVDQ